ncbi:transposase, partial [Brachybacterium paraconglomeratum]
TGKSDPLDAEAAARTALCTDVEKLAHPRRSGDRAALRVLLASRSLTDQQRTANKNALTALLRTTDVGIDARKPLTDVQIATIAAWRTGRDEPSHRIFREEARRLAKAIIEQTRSLQQNHQALSVLTETLAPGLQGIPGVGPVTGAILVASYSHHGRVRSEAAFAALGGIAPLPASSGNTSRHRLSRSGDRQLNRAVDVVVRTRMSYDPDTCAYVERRRA